MKIDNNDQITFDIFTQNDIGRNTPNTSLFASLKENNTKKSSSKKNHSKESRKGQGNQNKRKYFKFQNSIELIEGMSFGKNNKNNETQLMNSRRSSSRPKNNYKNPLRELINLPHEYSKEEFISSQFPPPSSDKLSFCGSEIKKEK